MVTKKSIAGQYDNTRLFERIIENLNHSGISLEMINRKHISAFDEFHVRGREVTTELVGALNLTENQKVLDVGCGVGGPCRMIAEKFNCQVYGLDLAPEHIRTASLLSKQIGLDHLTTFVQGDALNLPFEIESFDLAVTQHVQMNIEDKRKFYSEIYRVLKPGGKFIYYDVFGENQETLYYPLPWADDSAVNHLINSDTLSEHLNSIGLQEMSTTNQTEKGLTFITTFLERAKTKPSLLTGQKLLMGPNSQEKLTNILRCLSEKKIVLQSGIWEKGSRDVLDRL